MKIALIAPPFIPVPPKKYGGTELFVAELALGLKLKEIDVVVYTNGESTIDVPVRWLYPHSEWPLPGEAEGTLKGINHAAWAVKEAIKEADIIHLNSAPGLSLSRFIETPMVYTVHHAYQPAFSEFYENAPEVAYVTISDFQRKKLLLPNIRTIHHGINPALYPMQEKKQEYLSFLGRIAPPKGTHLAIQIAKQAGIPLKIAGEIQPIYKDYWETQVKPHVDGKFIEYVGEAGMEEKIELLSNSLAMVFPVQWDEPFGLVMIEAMACGTPVLAFPGGSVAEVVKEGVSGCVRKSAEELAKCVRSLKIPAKTVRGYMEEFFSVQRMTRDYINLYSEILHNRVAELERQIVA
ncbi:MAG TPA: glycosyltransferase family 4 protein [Candidatus Angelobacter sp.]|nr:glycosyltransferase family 4 protein [Candidatus Angelobacter sp.]